MPLPYENATSGKNALNEMQTLLKGFGASSFGVMEDFEAGELIVQFQWRQRRVTIKASVKGYAAAWLRQHPWSNRVRSSLIEHQRKALKQAEVSVYSILRDWIKGQVTAVEIGMLSFEGAFLGQILLGDGRTVLDAVSDTGLLRLESDNAS
jgi:hypothetical protein